MTLTKRFKKSSLLYFEKIIIKLIFSRYISLDLSDYHKFKIIPISDKNDKKEDEDKKTKVKQLKNKKQCLKYIEVTKKTCQ